MAVIVGGEALIDLVPGRGDTLVAHPGGGPFNTARALGRLGVETQFLGTLSDDRFGTLLRERLTADGVALGAGRSTSSPTTLALAEVDAAGAAGYRFYADGTSAGELTPEQALAALPERVAALHIGTLGLVLEPLASALAAVQRELYGRALVVVDPNCRPAFIPDRDVYRARLRGTLARTDVVKISEDDLAWLTPGAGVVDGARALLADGPAAVLVTLGAAGVLVVTAEAQRAVPARRVDVIDTIGAGDAFSAGVLAWWLREPRAPGAHADLELLAGAAALGCEVAARTCERAGAEPPRLEELFASGG